MPKVQQRAAIIACGFVSALGVIGFALAGPFTRPPSDYGTVVNDVLAQAGSELRFHLMRCGDVPFVWCRFSSIRVEILVEGGGSGSGMPIARVIIAADILEGHPAVRPDVIVTDAFIALAATMIVFDPDLPPDRRHAMVSRLVAEVHKSGHGEDSGVAADYVIDLRREAKTLLVMNVIPKRAP